MASPQILDMVKFWPKLELLEKVLVSGSRNQFNTMTAEEKMAVIRAEVKSLIDKKVIREVC